ncbi:MAG: hypothetical protein NT166_32445 [Candidatus Aminicenantes bacterium]|nr:hypothetical protein [Candidatus Aminicenantes bacterium]
MQILKFVIAWFSLLYLTLYIPFAFMVYFSPWYKLNCRLHPISQRIPTEKASVYVHQLTGFFLHCHPLETDWSAKEKFHLNEVLGIFDVLAGTAILSLALFGFTFNKKHTRKLAGINMLIIISLLIIIPFFRYFWVSILHPLLFNNLAWKTNPMDVSFFLLPPAFFYYSTILLIAVSFIINLSLWLSFRVRK